MLLRHAKSAWPDGVDDHERPLAARGRRDAPAVGRWLLDTGLRPEVAVVSSALRTLETFHLVAAELPEPPSPRISDEVYRAGAGELLDVVRSLVPELGSALVVGHNPGIGTLANVLDDGSSAVEGRDRMRLAFPTSAIAVLELGCAWNDVDPGAARLAAFAVPRG